MKFESLLLIEDYSPHAAGIQMAIDQALLEQTSGPILRIYRWATPCVTIGYFERLQTAQEDFPGLEITRRWTGGGSVAHGSDWPYSLIIPRSHVFSKIRPAESYQIIHTALAAVLATPLKNVELATRDSSKVSAACFENPVQFDILRSGEKIAGAGQRRSRVGLLHQGSLQLHPESHPQAKDFANTLADFIEPIGLSAEILHAAKEIADARYNNPHWLRSR
ncbi:MAG: hypothetical protein WCO60_05290 [Verrucomicrobiota bacterium]